MARLDLSPGSVYGLISDEAMISSAFGRRMLFSSARIARHRGDTSDSFRPLLPAFGSDMHSRTARQRSPFFACLKPVKKS